MNSVKQRIYITGSVSLNSLIVPEMCQYFSKYISSLAHSSHVLSVLESKVSSVVSHSIVILSMWNLAYLYWPLLHVSSAYNQDTSDKPNLWAVLTIIPSNRGRKETKKSIRKRKPFFPLFKHRNTILYNHDKNGHHWILYQHIFP